MSCSLELKLVMPFQFIVFTLSWSVGGYPTVSSRLSFMTTDKMSQPSTLEMLCYVACRYIPVGGSY